MAFRKHHGTIAFLSTELITQATSVTVSLPAPTAHVGVMNGVEIFAWPILKVTSSDRLRRELVYVIDGNQPYS